MFRSFIGILLAAGIAIGQSPQPQHRLEITVEQKGASGWVKVDPATVFESGARLRFRVKSNFLGFLYVMNQGTSGSYTLLFPREDTGSDNRLEPERETVVPATDGAFSVVGPEGYDIVYWMITPAELATGQPRPGYVPLPPPPPAGTKLNTLRPRCDDTIFKARGECIDKEAGPRKVDAVETLPQNLKSVPDLKARELVFIRENGAAVVSTPPGLNGPVVYEFRVAHK
jgi:hypothetical protein